MSNQETEVCSQCNQDMSEGYVLEGGVDYYCSDKCLLKNMTKNEFLELFMDGYGDSYWTTF